MRLSPSLQLRPMYVLTVLTMILPLLLAACGGVAASPDAEAPAATEPPGVTAVPTEPPAQEGPQELVVGVAQDQYRLEGDGANLGLYPLNTNIGETLFKLTPDYKAIPWLRVSPTSAIIHGRSRYVRV